MTITRRTAIKVMALSLPAVACGRWIGGSKSAGRAVAFSLRDAERRLRAGQRDPEIAAMAGITQFLGFVHDPVLNDALIVGLINPVGAAVALDDLVAAIRSLVGQGEWPLVSIDRTPATPTTKKQRVRFEGVAGSGFGQQLLAADVFLKHAALGLAPADHLGMPSFFDRCTAAARDGKLSGQVGSRLWFHAADASLLSRDNVTVIRDLRVGVKAEMLGATDGRRDALSDEYAAAFSAKFDDLATRFPAVLRNMTTLFGHVGLASGMTTIDRGLLNYWLNEYPLPAVATPTEFDLIRREARIGGGAGASVLELDGGIDMTMLSRQLAAGDHTAFRTAVLASRPTGSVLSWPVPLAGWRFAAETREASSTATDRLPGSEIERRLTMPSLDMPNATDPRGGVKAKVLINPNDIKVKKP